MQVLKDAVRKKIKVAAIETFKADGYQKASMRRIAEKAEMSPGNLYRYYKNKEALFGELVKPVIKAMKEGEKKGPPMNLEMVDVNLMEHTRMIEELIEARHIFRDELFLLFLRAEGSPYEGTKETYTKFIEGQTAHFFERHFSKGDFLKGNLYIKAAAGSFVEAFCTVLEHSESDRDFYINMLEYAELMIKPSIRNLIAIRDNTTNFRRISDEEIYLFFSRHNCSGDTDSPESNGSNK